jgi:hypothetical protein
MKQVYMLVANGKDQTDLAQRRLHTEQNTESLKLAPFGTVRRAKVLLRLGRAVEGTL